MTGVNPRAARSPNTPGNAVTVSWCPKCMLTIDPLLAVATCDRTVAAPGSVKSKESTS